MRRVRPASLCGAMPVDPESLLQLSEPKPERLPNLWSLGAGGTGTATHRDRWRPIWSFVSIGCEGSI